MGPCRHVVSLDCIKRLGRRNLGLSPGIRVMTGIVEGHRICVPQQSLNSDSASQELAASSFKLIAVSGTNDASSASLPQ